MFSGFHVPVHVAPPVGVVQRPGHRCRHRPGLCRRHPVWICPNARLQISARHQRHGVEVQALALAELMDGNDVRVVEPGRRSHLPLEALDPLRVTRKLGWEGFQRHLTSQALVLGPVDVGHSPAAQQRDDAVVA